MVSGTFPHSHVVSPLKYFHLLLRHLHAVQRLVCPFARLSSRLTAQLCHNCNSLQRMTFAWKSAGRVELRKHSLFKHLSAGIWPCRECVTFISCFFFSTLAVTSLLMSGGAIPATMYISLTSVGLRHPVIDLPFFWFLHLLRSLFSST